MTSVSQLPQLPAEIQTRIGQFLPDVKSVVAFTSTCKALNALRDEILVTDLSKLVETLEILARRTNKAPLNAFLEQCTTSPYRQTPFVVSSFKVKQLIQSVFPNVQVLWTSMPIDDSQPRIIHCAPPPPRPLNELLKKILLSPNPCDLLLTDILNGPISEFAIYKESPLLRSFITTQLKELMTPIPLAIKLENFTLTVEPPTLLDRARNVVSRISSFARSLFKRS